MNEKEKALRPEDSDFSLEDILREFGDAVSEEPEEDIRIWDGRTPLFLRRFGIIRSKADR